MTIDKLFCIIKQRQKNLPENSYVASLIKGGVDVIGQKIGEETTELIIAAKNGKRKEIIAETADLWFFTLVLLAINKIRPVDVMAELDKRNHAKV